MLKDFIMICESLMMHVIPVKIPTQWVIRVILRTSFPRKRESRRA
jgi:hypothetical protein